MDPDTSWNSDEGESFEEGNEVDYSSKVDGSLPLPHCFPSQGFTVDATKSSESFDYSRFTSYLSLLNQQERQVRILFRKQGKMAKWLELDFYTDEVLHDELASIYGEMDKASEKYTKIFTNYKEDRLEEINEWISEEKLMIKNMLDAGEKLIDPLYEIPENQVIDPLQKFSEDEIQAFNEISQSKATTQRFVLPRPWFNDASETNASSPNQNTIGVSLSEELHEGIEELEQLQRDTSVVLQSHPTGILPVQLVETLRKKKSGPSLTLPMLHQLSSLYFAAEIHNTTDQVLLYPSELEGLIKSPADFFQSILHKFEFLLMFKGGSIPVPEAFSLFENLFKFKLKPSRLRAWGFKSQPEFLMVLLQHFDNWDMTVIGKPKNESLLVRRSAATVNTSAIFKHKPASARMKGNELEAYNSSLETRLFPSPRLQMDTEARVINPRIPSDCMQPGEVIETVSSALIERASRTKEIGCLLLHYFNPMNFYIVLSSNWTELERYQSELTKSYEELDSRSPDSIAISENLLLPELYVIVIHTVDNVTDYYRARYLKQERDRRHRVFLVDYGKFLSVVSSDIRWMQKCAAYDFRLQAIWCGIYNVLPQEQWDNELSNSCYEMIYSTSTPFFAKFMNRVAVDGKYQWFLKASGINPQKFPDVGEALKKIRPPKDAKWSKGGKST